MKTNIQILYIIFICNAIFAQAPEALWTKTFGGSEYDAGHAVLETFDGNYIIAGVTYSQHNADQDIWLIKTDNKGDTLWTETFGGKFDDGCGSVIETPDHSYLICGSTKFSHNTNEDILLIKTNMNGKTIWKRTFGGAGSEKAYAIQKTNDDAYIVAGFTDSYGAGKLDMLLFKADESGDILWTKTYGGPDDDRAASIKQTSDGGFILVGSTDSYGAGRLDMMIVKTDSFGDTIWTKVYGGSHFDYGNSVIETSDGGYIVAGYTTPIGNMWGDVWTVKLNFNGNIQWTQTFGGQGYDFASYILEIENNEYIVLASTESYGAGSSDLWLIHIDSFGSVLWDKTYGGFSFEYGLSFAATKDAGFIITGRTASYGAGYYDVWLVKTAANDSRVNQIDSEPTPKRYYLRQNYPNPFNPTTTIEFSISKKEFVSLNVYNMLGREMLSLVDKKLTPGKYSYDWDASNYASGVYYYTLKAGNYQESKKLILLK